MKYGNSEQAAVRGGPGIRRRAGGASPATVLRVSLAVVVLAAGLVTMVVTAKPATAATYQDWPMFLQNTSRTNATVDPNLSVAKAPTLKLKWSFPTGGPIATSTSIVGTTAYIGSWDGYEYAVNTGTGALIWKSPSLGLTTDPGCNPSTIGITSSADVENGVLYVGGGGPYWYALNASTGAILWSVYTGDNSQAGAHYNWSSPLIYNGNAYIGIASNCDNPLVQGQLLEVSLTTHQIVNTYNFVPNGQLGGGVWTTPTLDTSTTPATIFVTTGTLNDYTQTQSQAIVALNSSTLAYEGSWQLPFTAAVSDSDWGTTPTLSTNASGTKLISAANKNGILYTWKRSDLELGHTDPNPPLWQRQIAVGGAGPTEGDGSIASGIFANGTLYLRRGPQRDQRQGVGRVDRGLRPGDRGGEVGTPDRAAHHRGAGLRQRHGGLWRGQHLRGPQRGQRSAALLLPAASDDLRGDLGGPEPVLHRRPQRVGVRLRPQQLDHHAAGRPQLPGQSEPGERDGRPGHLSGHPQPGRRRVRGDHQRDPHRHRLGSGHPRHLGPVPLPVHPGDR